MTSFGRFVTAQASTRVAKVRQAKKMFLTPREEFKVVDYWLALRRASIEALIAGGDKGPLDAVNRTTTDKKKIENYRPASAV